jgi:hypothetical protein
MSGRIVTSNVVDGAMTCDEDLRQFILSNRAAQLYHTATWRQVIENETGSSAVSVITRGDDGEISAWMPLFLKQGPIGTIANSSPFFGSHGGILAESATAFDTTLRTALDYLRSQDVLSLNVIHGLNDELNARYAEVAQVAGEVSRVAHVKNLQGMADRNDLFESLAGMTRSNLRRKCWKSGIAVERDESSQAVSQMLGWHRNQMRAMNIEPKSPTFFESLSNGLPNDGVEGRLYVGRLDGEMVAALFVCVWREWVEYLTPAFDLEHRHIQPLSAVIFDAMHDCALDGLSHWNFGGSGKNLSGVKAFKESWNGANIDYRYYIFDTGNVEDVRRYAQENGNRGYEGFFLYPF